MSLAFNVSVPIVYLLWLGTHSHLLSAVPVEFCALRVSVVDSTGAPAYTDVKIQRTSGARLGAKMTDERGVAEFCDLGLDLFDVIVGPPVCGQVTVKSIYFIWPRTRNLRVVYENCHTHGRLGGCQVLVYVRDSNGKPIEGALLKNGQTHLATDRYGRIFRWLSLGDTIRASVEKVGYSGAPIAIECNHTKPFIEQVIKLEIAGQTPK